MTPKSPMRYLFTPDKALLTSVSLPPVAQSAAPRKEFAAADGREESFYPPRFLEALWAAIRNAAGNKSQGALLLMSLNNLAMIVSAYGHDSSEEIVHGLMEQLTRMLGESGAVYRLHRDQLGIILKTCNREETEETAERIGAMARHYGSGAHAGPLHVLCAIGSVLFPDGAGTPQAAIDHAYIALHNTKGILHRAFDDAGQEADAGRQQMGLANYLSKAMQEDRMRLAYQPIIESGSGRIAHYEALLRAVGDDGKISSAGALIPVAERMGLIGVIDLAVLDMVVAELERAPEVTLAFNVSNLTTDNAVWLEHCRKLLKNRPEIAVRLIVEITETAAQRDLRRTAYFVACLQELGCQVALDDFGSGYTSFRQLKALSVDMVKIDGAFVRDLADNADNRFFVKTLLDFTNGFGLMAVAEYVETGETAKMLMELGVQYMQGYYFGKPQNFRGWLNEGEYSPS